MRVLAIETQEKQLRYVVIDDTGGLVEPIVRYLKFLDRTGAARHTLRSYAFVLKQYWEFLSQEHIDWQQIALDDFSRFVLWLKLPTGSLKVLPVHPVPQARSHRTINHAITVVTNFYDYHWRMEAVSSNVKDKTTTYLPAHARRYKSFLHHLSKGAPVAKSILKQKEEKRPRPKTITKDQVQQLIDACANQRDRLLIRLLYESAMRVGKVHTAEVRTNHLFIKLHGKSAGQALAYTEVDSLFRRLRKCTGIEVTPHVLRHTMLTKLAELGWQPEHLQERAGHASFQQTYQTYVHPSQEALREAWEQTQSRIALSASSGKEENA